MVCRGGRHACGRDLVRKLCSFSESGHREKSTRSSRRKGARSCYPMCWRSIYSESFIQPYQDVYLSWTKPLAISTAFFRIKDENLSRRPKTLPDARNWARSLKPGMSDLRQLARRAKARTLHGRRVIGAPKRKPGSIQIQRCFSLIARLTVSIWKMSPAALNSIFQRKYLPRWLAPQKGQAKNRRPFRKKRAPCRSRLPTRKPGRQG